MSEITTLSLERLNNGAHFLFISNVLTRADSAHQGLRHRPKDAVGQGDWSADQLR